MIRPLWCILSGAAHAAWLGLALGCGAPEAPPAKPAAASTHAHDDHPGEGDDHAHHHGGHAQPATLAEGLGQLEKAVVTISTSLATGAKDAADDAVHDVGHLLEDLGQMVEKQEWTADMKETGRKAVAELTDCFDKLDQSLHAAEGQGESALTVLGSVTERIGKSIVSLGELIKGAKPSSPEATKEDT